ncbi:MAG: hypothetical protein LC114_27060 [Bryobacterales bacterium]|nr:hypothetical protein [Bryobacterales bacterium]
MHRNIRKSLILLASLAWLPLAFASVAGDWKKAQKEGTWSAYLRFVSKHPEAAEAAEARRRMEEMERETAWKAAMAASSVDQRRGISDYLRKYPGSPHEAEAQARLKALLAESMWERAKQSDAEETYRLFAGDYPDSPFAAEAETRADAARARALEADWGQTMQANRTSAFREFIARHPGAPQEAEARLRIEAIVTERERTTLEPLRKAVAQAESLDAVPLHLGDFAKNLAIRAPGSLMNYEGAFIRVVGDPYARKPGEQAFEAITTRSFVILSIGQRPDAVADVIAHTAKISWPVGYMVDANGAMTLVVPAELIPCELEFVDAVRTRIPLRRRSK